MSRCHLRPARSAQFAQVSLPCFPRCLPGGPSNFRALASWASALALALALSLTAGSAQAQGITVAIGGALQDNNHAVWSRLVQLAGGRGACFSVFATAAGDPDASAAAISANLARHGAKTVHVRVSPRIAGQDVAAEVRSERWLEAVRGCRGVFFSGGAQERLRSALRPGGQDSPLLLAVRQVWQRGGVVAGTSSGAAVLSAVAFRDAPDPLAVMKGRLREGQEWAAGFGFLPAQVLVDQHFIRRGRIARLLPLMQAQGLVLGVGVEEDSAALFQGDTVEALGRSGVLVADLTQATRNAQLPGFNLAGATLHWLQSGDRFRLEQRVVQPPPAALRAQLLQPLAAGHRGYHSGPIFITELLAEGRLVQALAQLVDSDQREARGLAFAALPAADDPAPELGFEWRLWVDEGTRGWLTLQPTAVTVAGVRLDIVPVRVQRPLYVPLAPTGAGAAKP